MARIKSAHIKGRVHLRPWRVAPIIDTNSPAEVLGAIKGMTDVWGGYYLPILDKGSSNDEIKRQAAIYGLDSLYCEEPSSGLESLLRIPGYFWRGGGEAAPFAPVRYGFRQGLLGVESLPGVPDLDSPWRRSPVVGSINDAYVGSRSPGGHSRPIQNTRSHLRLRLSYANPAPLGIFVVRPETPTDVVWFWNCRSIGADCYPIEPGVSNFNQFVLADLIAAGRPTRPVPDGKTPMSEPIPVWGWNDLDATGKAQLESWSIENGMSLEARPRDGALAGAWFTGFEPVASRAFRTDVDPSRFDVNLELPRLPFLHQDSFAGIVAAEVIVDEASGLDPRLSASIPPYRQHAELLERSLAFGTRHVRVSGDGPVFGIDAGSEEVSMPLATNLDIMRLVFDDAQVETTQSEVGKFQSRVAEMLGGSLGGDLTQPGLRAGLDRVAEKSSGVTLSELQNIVEKSRGDWPDPLFHRKQSARDYAVSIVRRLLASGLLVPLLDLECTACGVVNRVGAADLGIHVRCDFCAQDFLLAHGLALSKPTWRYKLGGHLPSDKVRALFPALASLATLAALVPTQGPPMPHVLGLEVKVGDRNPIEVDVAAVLRDDHRTVVLGEVKGHYPIDRNDVENLGFLQKKLWAKSVPSVLMFGTLRSEFSADEKAILREFIDRGVPEIKRGGMRIPAYPLLFTADDISRPWSNPDHPWRWRGAEFGSGVLSSALESCKRHLGLLDHGHGGGELIRWTPLL